MANILPVRVTCVKTVERAQVYGLRSWKITLLRYRSSAMLHSHLSKHLLMLE